MNHPAFENTALGRGRFEEPKFALDALQPARKVKALRVSYRPGATRAAKQLAPP